MTFKDLLFTIFGNLGRMRWRTVLTTTGVVVGTTALVLLVSLGVGLQRLALNDVGKQFGAATIITVAPLGAGGVMIGTPSASTIASAIKKSRLDDTAVRRFKKLPHVRAAIPGREILVTRIRYRKFEGPPFPVVGIDRKTMKGLNLQIGSGKSNLNGKEVLLGAKVPKEFYNSVTAEQVRNLELLGARLDIFIDRTLSGQTNNTGDAGQVMAHGALEYRFRGKVRGVLKAGGPPENDFRIYVSMRQAEKLAKFLPKEKRNQYSWVKVKIDAPSNVTATQGAVEKMGFSVTSLTDMLKGINLFFVAIQAILGGVASIALLVAAFGVANTMTMAIYERTREIGIMKAIGASNRMILQIFLAEAAVIGFLGGTIGVLLGYLGGKLINFVLYIYFAESLKEITGGFIFTPLWLALFTIIFATTIGFLSGILPASRASRLSPLSALRHD